MTTRALFSLFVLSCAFGSIVHAAPAKGDAGQSAALDDALSRWRTRQGPEWRVESDPHSGFARMLYGGRAPAAFPPREDADFVRLARRALEETSELFGIDASTLEEEHVQFLPLGQIGSSDKFTVRMRQAVGGVRVVGGFVNVLFDAQGRLLSVQSTSLPDLEGFPVLPTYSERAAEARARTQFREDEGLAPTRTGAPELVIDSVLVAKRWERRLAWQIDVRHEAAAIVPVGFIYWIDALDGSVLHRARSVHEFDVGGTVSSMATPGLAPDTASNPETSQIMRYARVQSSQGTVYTDANGNFNYPGVNSPLSCTFTYVGTFNNVQNNTGAAYSLTQSLPPNQANAVTLNPAPTDTVTAQANAFIHINHLRDWVRSVNPSDATADFVATANVNLAQTCNAYYDGVSVNFFAAGGNCPNTAYTTVVAHETGHWLNDRYGTGNGSDGMGEGNADVWAMYSYDDPIVGLNFCGSGCNVRNGNNTRQFCGDCCGGCYGEVHADGEVWMGAAWKIRTRLDNTNGNAAGDLIANNLFLGWMNGYNQPQIQSVIETQWLTLDDNDGNINNGTPHYPDIDGGFRDQGFPGFTLPTISITNVTDLPDTSNVAGPYAVSATIVAQMAPPLTSATLRYRRNGAAFTSLPLTNGGGNVWSASIPGQAGGARVDYYVTATDSGSNTVSYPSGAPAQTLAFAIGVLTGTFSDNFESAGDNGWTHATVGDTSNLEDDWQRGAPAGRSGTSFGVFWTDPSSAVSPTRCWANDLGISGAAPLGAYGANVHNYLRSPAINLSGKWGTRLRFKRWLTVEEGVYDQARILVNGTQAWTNPFSGNLLDTSWSTQEVELGALADNSASVQIEFQLKSDGGLQLGGWALDDVEILYYAANVDSDGDGVPDASDNCPGVSNPNQADVDGDGVGDVCDNCPSLSNPGQEDCDNDQIGDVCEIAQGAPDCNGNLVPDSCDVASGSSQDVNANGIPDECEGVMVGFCYPSVAGTRSCPCGNPQVPALSNKGCDNFGPNPAGGTGGATLTAQGVPHASLSSTLQFNVGSMIAPASGTLTLLWRGDMAVSPGFQSGAGVRCIANNLTRIYKGQASGGAISFPNVNQTTNSWTASGMPGAGATRYYYASYRNAQAGAPCGDANLGFNLSNGGAVTWMP